MIQQLHTILRHQAMRTEDPKLYAMMKSRRQKDRELNLREREVRQKDEALLVKNRELELAGRKFLFSAAKAVLQHAEKVRPIIDGPGSEDEKTEKLGQAIFGEDWK